MVLYIFCWWCFFWWPLQTQLEMRCDSSLSSTGNVWLVSDALCHDAAEEEIVVVVVFSILYSFWYFGFFNSFLFSLIFVLIGC